MHISRSCVYLETLIIEKNLIEAAGHCWEWHVQPANLHL